MENGKRLILILDESGEKQYSDKQGSWSGDMGVAAGFLLFEHDVDSLSNLCKELFSEYKGNGKLHITDIDDSQKQEEVRNKVIGLFNDHQIRWFYEAIYSQGFHENFHSESRSGYKTYGGKKHLLHTELLGGMFHKAMDLCAQAGFRNVHIRVIVDRVDKSIIKKFKIKIESLLDMWLGRESVITSSDYNPRAGEVKKRELKSMARLEGLFQFNHFTYEVSCEGVDITILADVLSNMTRHYLMKKRSCSTGIELNSKEAISEHPLKKLAITAGSEGYFKDWLYRCE